MVIECDRITRSIAHIVGLEKLLVCTRPLTLVHIEVALETWAALTLRAITGLTDEVAHLRVKRAQATRIHTFVHTEVAHETLAALTIRTITGLTGEVAHLRVKRVQATRHGRNKGN